MRILYLGDTASPHYRAWPSHFTAKGLEVHSCHVSLGEPGPPIPGVVEHGPAARLPVQVRGSWLAGAVTVARVRRSIRPDIVHSHQVLPSGYLAELTGADPHVATAWGSEVLLARRLGRRLIRRVALGADLFTADSRHLLESLRSAGADSSRLRWVPWGVDSEWAAPALAMDRGEAAGRAGLLADRPIVLSHRGPGPVYRQEDFLRAMSLVAAARPDVLGVIPAFDRTPGRRDTAGIRDRIVDLGLEASVEVVDPWGHREMPFAYRAASVCVSVPESESAPTSVFEALAVETPVIVSELPWVSEPVYEEAQLSVVGVGDHRALAAAIQSALAGELDGASKANRELVARSLDRDLHLDAIGDEYDRLIASAGRV